MLTWVIQYGVEASEEERSVELIRLAPSSAEELNCGLERREDPETSPTFLSDLPMHGLNRVFAGFEPPTR